MVYIVITSHGSLCEGLYESYTMIAGKAANVFTVSLNEKGIGDYKARLTELLDRLCTDGKVLILCDLKGGTPYNESYLYFLAHSDCVKVVTGVNLPMLIEALMNSVDELSEMAENAKESGITGIETAENEDCRDEDDDDDIAF